MPHIFQNIKNPALATLALLLAALVGQAQNPFPTGGFTLPPGKSIIVTYEVTVNANACPTGTVPLGNIANQSQVQGSNFATVNTDDPDVAGASNHTVTPFGAITIGNMVYNDLNRNGLFDGSDVGINMVLVNLYVDDGDGVLDMGDGAPIANTHTTNGLYSFTVCPGAYIVEVAASNFAMSGALYNGGIPFISSPVGGAPDPDINTTDSDDNGDPVSGFGVATAAFTVAYNPNAMQTSDYSHIDLGFKTPTTVTIGDRTLAEGTGGGPTAFNFTVSRNDNSEAFSLTVNTSAGTATSGTDYEALSNITVSFTAGGGTDVPVTVNVMHDNIVENNETFSVLLSGAPTGVIITDGTGDGTINNDDAATVTLSGNASQAEGNSGNAPYVITLTLDNPVQGGFMITGTLNSGTATFPTDFNGATVTHDFVGNAGETRTMNANIFGDVTVELNETFTLSLSAPTGAPAGVTTGPNFTGTINNDDAATVGIAANVSQSEAITPQAFSVTLSNPVDVPVTVNVASTSGTATISDPDYSSLTGTALTFPANTTTAQIASVNIINDNKVEGDEIYGVNVQSISASGRNVIYDNVGRSGTILNDDMATVTLSPAGGVTQNEGNSGMTNFVFTATLNNPVQGGFSLPYTTNDGTATTADNDYVDNDGPALAFTGTANEAQTITVQVNGDNKVEANETFTVNLGAVTAATPVQTAAISIAGSPKTGAISNDEVDWGDAPDTYGTLSTSNGARHNTVLGFRLGASIDGETDGQPNANADGDGADDDGVTLPGALVIGTMANITVNVALVSGTGKIDAWVDFDRNGVFDVGERIFNTYFVGAGNTALSFPVPAGATPGPSYARFRLSSFGGLDPTGSWPDGEVEDYKVEIVANTYSISSPTVTEGNAPNTVTLTYTISRLNNTNAGSVDYSAPTGTATAGSDYTTIPTNTINFTAGGNMSETVSVTVNGDNIVEDNETVILTLSNPVNGGIGTGTGTGTITNDDNATLTLSGGGSATESTINRLFYLGLSAPVQGGFTIAYSTVDGTALTSDNDYNGVNTTLNFAGNPETKTIVISTNNDTKVELNEAYDVVLGAITNISAVQAAAITISGSPQTVTITNEDMATVSIAGNVSQAENLTPEVFSVTLSNPVDVDVTVNFNTADNTATTGDNDYTGIVNQVVTFNAGTTTAQTVHVTVNNDNKVEANEVFDVSIGNLLAGGRNVSLGNASRTGTITNDDATTVTLTPAGGVTQAEGNSGTTNFVFTATPNNPVQGGFTLAFTTDNGTATTADNDYTDNDNTLTFADNSTVAQNITVQVTGDNKVEANETFTVNLGTASAATPVQAAAINTSGSPKTGTITNDEVDWGDAPNTYGTLLASNGARHNTVLGFRLGASIDGETDGQPNANADGDGADDDGVTLPGALVIGTMSNITVNVALVSGTGKLDAWVDFDRNGVFDTGERIFNTYVVGAGNTALSFAVPAGATPGPSYARFRLSSFGGLDPTGSASDGEVEDYKVEIVNTQFSIDDPLAIEGNAGTTNLTFTISRTVNANACSVQYAITGGTATTGDSDYQVLAMGTANFIANGPLTQTFNVVVNGDTKVELNETVEISLSNPVNGSILDGFGVGTINNDDAATLSITSPIVTEGDAGTQNMTFNVSLSNPSDENVSVNFATINGTATTADLDYQSNSGAQTFTPGQTTKQVVVLINGDCKIEPNETLILRLSGLSNNGRNVSLSGGGATLDGTGTVQNNDAPPMITCPQPATISCDASQLPANTGMATATDNCAPITIDYTDAITQGPCTGNYTITRTWKATDNTNDMSTCVQTIAVVDNTPPVPVCRTATVTLTGAGVYTLTAADVLNLNSSSDNCSDVSVVTISPSVMTCAQLGQTVAVLTTVEDDCGNPAQCTAQITVVQGTALPSGWTAANIGTSANGHSLFEPCTNGGSFTLDAQGYTTNTTDVQHAVYKTLCGNSEIIAHVSSLAPGAGWAGIQMRETTSQGSKKVTLKTQLSTILRREARTITFGSTNTLQSGIPSTHTWLRLTRTGSVFNAYSSVDGVTWVFRSSVTISMSSCIQVGIFVESFNNTTTTQATFNNVSVSGSVSPLAQSNTLNTDPYNASMEVGLYPNPSTGAVNLDLTNHLGQEVQVEVLSTQGTKLRQHKIAGVQGIEVLDLSTLPKGMYLVKVTSVSTMASVTQLLVLE